jgi:shikimate dehydrogenase
MAESQRFLLAGVMGWPVMHSRSPMLHGYWMKQLGLAGAYVPLTIEPAGLAAALRALEPLQFAGCNLTIPHKQAAMAIVDEVDPIGRTIGAISCIVVRPDGSLFGSNNDWYGFVENVKASVSDWRATGPAVVLGAGGGARAVCYGLLQLGVPSIRLVNRTLVRAQALAADFDARIDVLPWGQRHDVLPGAAIVVNATSAGMVGTAPLDVRLDLLDAGAVVGDIIYTPLETPFLAAARARGNRTFNGLGMLLHQGRPAWKAWFGIEPEVTPALRALLEASLEPS